MEQRAWLRECGLDVLGFRHWWVEVSMDTEPGVRIRLELGVSAIDWVVALHHGLDGLSVARVRVSDGRCDDHDEQRLLAEMTSLSRFGTLARALEIRHAITFRRHAAIVRSNLPDAPTIVRRWLGIAW